MNETENFINFIKSKFTLNELRLAKFIFETDVLNYTMLTEKTKENDKVVDKPTNVLELNYLKMCARKLEDNKEFFERVFLFYVGYQIREFKNTWRLNLNNLDNDLKMKCSYCTVDVGACPFKLYTYIRKCIDDNKFDPRDIFERLVEENHNYSNNLDVMNYVVNLINEKVEDNMDLVGSKMLLDTDAIKFNHEENNIIDYTVLDFDYKTNSFFNNLNDYYIKGVGINGQYNVADVNFVDCDSHIFKKSPVEIAVFVKYLCDKNNIDSNEVYKRLLELRNFKESECKIAYYNQSIHSVDSLECKEEEKQTIKDFMTYIKNYHVNEDLPYIHFNVGLFTKNLMVSDRVVNILNRYVRTFNYINNKGLIWVDVEMLVKRTKDSVDMIANVERTYNDNDIIVFENIEKIRSLNEFRVDGFLTAVEKFANRNKRSMTIFVENEDVLKEITRNHPKIMKEIINQKIYISGFDVKSIQDKVENRLKEVIKIEPEFSQALSKYIEKTYNSNAVDEYTYIDNLCNDIIFNKFKVINVGSSFVESDSPKEENVREVDEILADINNMVGLDDVKDKVNDLVKYLEYSNKIDIEGFANLNMIFKGNSGTGKTTMARLFAELYYKLGFIKENKITEVSSKDLIGTHIGETAPKTQAVIDAALDGVLFIDEAYTIMASKGGTSTNYPAECIGTICKAMETYKDRLVVIFAGYTKEMNEFINANQGLMSRIGYELEFPDFTKEELLQIFNDEVEGNGFKLEDGVTEKIEAIIVKNRIGRNFGNARFVINLFDKLVLVHASNYKDDSELKLITNNDVFKYEETKKDKERTVNDILDELNSLIGLASVKDTINGFISVIELNRKLNRSADFNMHMIFKGNAGTGKTTVARLLAEIYYNLGYIKRNKLVEVQSQDLIGEFLGQTGPKTQAVIESALDGVLFIDEAYAIMEHNGTNASYSAECVATLLKAMEDYQGRLIVIFAGYTNEMMKFRDLNPGLKSRIGYEIDFEDYSIDELMEIFDKKVKDKDFKADDAAKEKVRKILTNAKEVENFGNGRFVENLVQKTIIEHAKKTRYENDYERLITFTEEDINEDIKAEESKRKIGF